MPLYKGVFSSRILWANVSHSTGRLLGGLLALARDAKVYHSAEGGVVEFFPGCDLLFVESLEVVKTSEFDAGVVGMIALDQDLTRPFPPSRSARHLHQELQGPFGCPKVREIQGDVCEDDAHQGDLRNVVSLGDHLGSDQDVQFLSPESAEDLLVRPFPACRVSVHSSDAGLGKKRPDLLFDLLRTLPDGLNVQSLAGWALGGRNGLVFAVMTTEALSCPMERKTHTAVRAPDQMPAIPARQGVSIASPVEEDEAFPALAPIPDERLLKGLRQGTSCCPVGGRLPHVDRDDLGLRPLLNSFGQLQESAFPPLHVVVGLEGRRCRAQDDDRLLPLASNERQVSGIVSDTILLFVRRIMFLVHDDDAQIPEGRKNCGTGTHRDACLSPPDLPPEVEAFPVGKA